MYWSESLVCETFGLFLGLFEPLESTACLWQGEPCAHGPAHAWPWPLSFQNHPFHLRASERHKPERERLVYSEF